MSQTATSLFLRGMPRDVIRLAKAEAARRGTTLGKVVADAIRSSIGDAAAAKSDPLADDLAWFEGQRGRLARRYRGAFVGVVGRRVVDHDSDFDALATRLFAKFGVRAILVMRTTREPEVVHVRSPWRSPAPRRSRTAA